MFRQARITMRLFCFTAAVALLALTAHSAPGKGGGGKTGASPTLEFDDAAGDAIRSDGNGAYEVSVQEDGIYTVISLSKKQTVFLDFSDCDHDAGLSCEGPFGPDTTSGYVGAAKIHLTYLDGEPVSSDTIGASIQFQTPEGKWSFSCIVDIARYDDDGDGTYDRYEFGNPGTTSDLLSKFFSRRGIGSGSYYEPHGRFFMPWGATLRIP